MPSSEIAFFTDLTLRLEAIRCKQTPPCVSEKKQIERLNHYFPGIIESCMQLVTSEIRDSAATALQAVKLFAQYQSGSKPTVIHHDLYKCLKMVLFVIQNQDLQGESSLQDDVLSTLSEWLSDSACNRNPTVLLMAGAIYSNEGMYEDALKACHSGISLEM
jgi:coatomer protein complex subunit epsilon